MEWLLSRLRLSSPSFLLYDGTRLFHAGRKKKVFVAIFRSRNGARESGARNHQFVVFLRASYRIRRAIAKLLVR